MSNKLTSLFVKRFDFAGKSSYLEVLVKHYANSGISTFYYYKYDEEYTGDLDAHGPYRQFNQVTSVEYPKVAEAVMAGYKQIDDP